MSKGELAFLFHSPLLSQSLREVAVSVDTKFLLFTFSEQTQHLTLNQPACQLYSILLGLNMVKVLGETSLFSHTRI